MSTLQPNTLECVIQIVRWQTHQMPLKAVREIVFVQEQQVPLVIEWDAYDATATHLLAYAKQDTSFAAPIGCARLLQALSDHGDPIGKIGRMAVLKQYRGLGIGKALLQKAIAAHVADGVRTIQLSAQLHAVAFYLNAGFTVVSAPYQDANIPHVDMRLTV